MSSFSAPSSFTFGTNAMDSSNKTTYGIGDDAFKELFEHQISKFVIILSSLLIITGIVPMVLGLLWYGKYARNEKSTLKEQLTQHLMRYLLWEIFITTPIWTLRAIWAQPMTPSICYVAVIGIFALPIQVKKSI